MFLDYKGKETSLANAHKLAWVWETYYKNDKIVKYKFDDLTVAILRNWFLDKISEYNLTCRKFKEMKSLMNMLYDYAIDSNLLKYNTSRVIRNISYKKFSVEHEKSQTESDFSDYTVHIQCQEINIMTNWKTENNPQNVHIKYGRIQIAAR